MNRKITYTAVAVAVAVLFGIIAVGQLLENFQLRSQIISLREVASACHTQQQESAAVQQGLKQLFSGRTPDPKDMP